MSNYFNTIEFIFSILKKIKINLKCKKKSKETHFCNTSEKANVRTSYFQQR